MGNAGSCGHGGSRRPRSSRRSRRTSAGPSSGWRRSAPSSTGPPRRPRSRRSSAQYRAWIESRESEIQVLDGERRSTAETLLAAAGFAAGRIERGIATLAGDPDALDAFRMANRAVAKALRRRLPEVNEPAWRPFQLAFLLINLPGLADPAAPDREHRRSPLLPDGRRQDRGVSGTGRIRDRAAKAAADRPGQADGRGRDRRDALHACGC